MLPAGPLLYRSYTAELGPWFSSIDGGCVDLPEPNDACCTAETLLVTLCEVWISIDVGHVRRERLLADVTSHEALAVGHR